MPPTIITSKTQSIYERPPEGPWVPNVGSWQAHGLVGWWPLSNDWPSGAKNYATIGSSPNMTTTGTYTRAPFFGGGWSWSNTGSTSNYLESSVLPVTAVPLSMACWFYPNNTTADNDLICISSLAPNNHYFALGAFGTAVADRVGADTGNNSVFPLASSSTAYVANKWQHAAGVWVSATSRSAFLNGYGKGTNTTSCTPSFLDHTNIGIYRDGGTTTAAVNGRIADARIYRIALTDPQVAALWEPNTRFELYYRTGVKIYSFQASSPPAGTFTKLVGSGGLAGVGGSIVGPGGLAG